MRILLVWGLFVAVLLPEYAFTAGKKNTAKVPVELSEDWYGYASGTRNGYSSVPPNPCMKTTYSPADAVEELEKHQIKFEIIERDAYKGKTVAVDIIQTHVSNVGSDYNSNGMARSYTREVRVNTSHYFRGERRCNAARDADLSGKMDKSRLERYR